MKTKEELIEAMADALRNDAVEVHKQIGDMEHMHIVENIDLYKLPAKIALEALCGALPDLTKKEPMSCFVEKLVITDAPKLYNQLKEMGNDQRNKR